MADEPTPSSRPAPSGTSPANGDDSGRREALRKAGAAYFDKVLKEKSTGKGTPVQPLKARRQPADVEDPDLETVGRVLEGARLYVFGALFFLSTAVSLVLIQASMQPLRTPGIQAFLHTVPLVGVLWFLADVEPLTGPVLKGALPSTSIAGLQVLSLFSALLYCDVTAVLAWITFVPHLLDAALAALLGRSVGMQQAVLLGVGGAAAALGCCSGQWPKLLGGLSLLAWAVAEAAKLAWRQHKAQPELLAAHAGQGASELLQAAAAQEARLGAPALEFYCAALPAVPMLLAGFMCREGAELVAHELSVPAVSTMLLSAAAWASASTTGVLLAEALSARSLAALRGAAAAGALGTALAVGGIGSVWALLSAVVVVACGVCLQLLPICGQQAG